MSRYGALDTKNCPLGRHALAASQLHLNLRLLSQRGGEAQGRTAFGKLMSVANRDKRAVVLIARDEDQVASTDES